MNRFLVWAKRASIALLVLLVLVPATLFIFRNNLLRYSVKKIQSKMQQRDLRLEIKNYGFDGVKSIWFSEILLVPQNGDTLFSSDSLHIKIRFLPLFAAKIRIQEIDGCQLKVAYIGHDSISNFAQLLSNKNKANDTTHHYPNYAALTHKLFKQIFTHTPDRVALNKIRLIYNYDSLQCNLYTDSFLFQNSQVQAQFIAEEKGLKHPLLLNANVDKPTSTLRLKLSSIDKNLFQLPFAETFLNAKIELSETGFDFCYNGSGSNDEALLNGRAWCNAIHIFHKKIAPTPVTFDSLSFNFKLKVEERAIELDSSSTLGVNQIQLHPWLRYHSYPERSVALAITPAEIDADRFFKSLPNGLFSTFEGIRTHGKLTFFMRFHLDFAQPDSLQFTAGLQGKQFHIDRFGAVNYRMIDTTFQYDIYESGVYKRSLLVGPQSPSFVPSGRVSPFLINAILTSEDPGFFYHNGFSPESFRQSIVTNIKQHRFARGGSTISMQLVKNVFLSRNKTIGRKLEEMLIVWLIENQRLVSKERMFDVYLNIIEWGPGVYGAKEASAFYFKKTPDQLTLAESIFMAGMIPKPRWFMYSFDENGHLKTGTCEQMNFVFHVMQHRNEVNSSDSLLHFNELELKGPAHQLLSLRPDTLASDSLLMAE